MRLTDDKIRNLAEKIYYEIERSEKFKVYANKSAMMTMIMDVFHQDLLFEEDVEAEATKKLQRFEREISSKNIDYAVLFRKVKKQILEEKGIEPEYYM